MITPIDGDEHNQHNGRNDGGGGLVLFPAPSAPMEVARIFMEPCQREGVSMLYYWRGGWWRWQTSHWTQIDALKIESLLYKLTENVSYLNDRGDLVKWSPNRRKIGDLLNAVRAVTILPNDTEQPSWLDDRPLGAVVALKNGLLDVEMRRLLPHTPLFFNQTSVPFDYDPKAPQPQAW